MLGLVISLFLRSRPARQTALTLVFVSAVSALPVVHYGQQGYDRVLSMSDGEGEEWLKAHMERAERYQYVYYILAALALAAIVAPVKWPRTDIPLHIATLAIAVAAMGIGGYIAYAGGKVRHKEFRNEPPPHVETHEHSH